MKLSNKVMYEHVYEGLCFFVLSFRYLYTKKANGHYGGTISNVS